MKPSHSRNNQNDHTQRNVTEEAEQYESRGNKNNSHSNQPYSRIGYDWKQRQQRKKMKKQIYGEHYNYDYHKPNQKKMYRVQENRNTQIEKANRMLLEKIQNIFKRSHGRRQNNQTQPISDLQSFNNATRSQSHSIRDIRNRQKIQTDYDKPSNLHDYVINQQVTRNSKMNRKKRNTEAIESMGSLNKGVQMAKMQILMQHQNQISKTGEASFNKNMVKLSAMQESMINKRKRVQTEMNNQPVIGSLDERTAKNMTEHRNMKTSPTQQVSYLQNLYELQSNQVLPHQHNHQVSTQRFQGSKKQNYKEQTKTQTNNQKIILYKGNNVKISGKQYNIQVFVLNSMYTILATSYMENGNQIEQAITVTYKDYQQLYRTILQHNHEKIVDHLRVQNKNGLSLLQISGFQRKYIDIFQHGDVTISQKQNSKQKQTKNKNVIVHYNKQDSASSKDQALQQNNKIKEQAQDKLNSNKNDDTKIKKLQNFSSNLINLQIQSGKNKQDQALEKTSIIKNSSKRIPPNPESNEQFVSDVEPPNKPQIKSIQKPKKQQIKDNASKGENSNRNSKVGETQKNVHNKNQIEEQVISDN